MANISLLEFLGGLRYISEPISRPRAKEDFS